MLALSVSQPLTPPGAAPSRPAVSSAIDVPPAGLHPSLIVAAVTVDVVKRLTAEFGEHLDPESISALVVASWRDLAGASAGALPELLERLARQRVLDALPRQISTASGQPPAPR